MQLLFVLISRLLLNAPRKGRESPHLPSVPYHTIPPSIPYQRAYLPTTVASPPPFPSLSYYTLLSLPYHTLLILILSILHYTSPLSLLFPPLHSPPLLSSTIFLVGPLFNSNITSPLTLSRERTLERTTLYATLALPLPCPAKVQPSLFGRRDSDYSVSYPEHRVTDTTVPCSVDIISE